MQNQITYNPLNLPARIEGPDFEITYVYSADGVKLQQIVTANNETTTMEYSGPFNFINGELYEVRHAYGELRKIDEDFEAIYKIYDHGSTSLTMYLGSPRVIFWDEDGDGEISSDEVLERIDAHPSAIAVHSLKGPPDLWFCFANGSTKLQCVNPFGLEHHRPKDAPEDLETHYRYTGQEHGPDGLPYYDYIARQYDPALGKASPERLVEGFLGVDDLAKNYPSISPYAYVANNPIRFIDPDGRKIVVAGQEWYQGAVWDGDQSDYGYFVFQALDYLVAHEGVGNLSFINREGVRVKGNVLLDFAKGGQFYDHLITISEITDGRHLYGAGVIEFDATAGLLLNPTEGQGEGIISPAILLLHEFGHAWLDAVNPELKERLARNFLISSSGISKTEYGDNVEHDIILRELENPASMILNQGVRTRYRATNWQGHGPGKNWRGIKNYDFLIRTKGPTSTQLKW